MKHALALAALLAATTTTPALAQNKTGQPINCAVYAEELSKTIEADERVTGTAEFAAVESLDKLGAHLRKVVAAGMEDTYRQSAAFGWDKATVDAKMAEGEAAVRAGFVGQTMEPGKVYTDHLLVINECGKTMMRQGHLGQADVDKLGKRMNAVYMQIR